MLRILSPVLIAILILLFPAVTVHAQGIGYGTKEIVIDSRSEFDHNVGTSIRFFKNNDEQIPSPVDLILGPADLSDPGLMLTEKTNESISSIITPNKNIVGPPAPALGELRLTGWAFNTDPGRGPLGTVEVYTDPWNRWADMSPDPTNLGTGGGEAVNSLPIGGLNWIYQSFKVYRSGQLAKIRLKLRRHPGASKGTGPGIYVAVLADDGGSPGKPVEGAVLGYAHLADNAPDLGVTPMADGSSPFKNIVIPFIGSQRPTLVAGTPYWLKISTMPYKR